ncbi:uncharacterized protein FTOL_11101 [Fusarium torulosum]|uniref:Uncharacterized protein n=1 Tax=Fusarium torulosum TaxID=33205 RepID=A0AAE8MHL3_9HYPO|nr:uncharacterized protein FTOL_11101 [Fusarium torulosum]
MESSPESVRPLKRVKYVQQDDTVPVDMTASDIRGPESMSGPLVTDVPMFDNPWALTTDLSSPSQVLFNLHEDLGTPWPQTFTATQPATLDLNTVIAPQPQLPRPQTQQRLPRLLPAVPERNAEPQNSRDETAVGRPVLSPFTANEDRLIVAAFPRYARPENGQVNGYVKFHWPSRTTSRRPSGYVPMAFEEDVEDITPNVMRSQTTGRSPNLTTFVGPAPAMSHVASGTVSPISNDGAWSSASPMTMMANSPISPQDSQAVTTGDPKMLPPQFGFQAKMDNIDRRLFEFYERIRQRINQRYHMADEYFCKLLNAPESRVIGEGKEVITMAVLLSMQDIVLTERRRKKPYQPRWLEGFKQGEYFLQKTDPGGRYWKNDNVQYDELRISQSIIVGRAVILAQPMMALPSPATMNPETEASRFSWLLYGTETDLFEIHGGCGFSKKLLHTLSQVTYCAARLQQEPESTIVPITAKFLLRELSTMRQWSREGNDWQEAQKVPQTIDWVREKADDVIIDSNKDMTDVTAEAWRIAAIIYFQCRLLRLPRNHPEVLANLEDLSKCIRIMPTSGSHFTAQAPLLPVFFLGLLATDPRHKKVSKDWFEKVVQTPVRSSVPPLYEALKRIWDWIYSDVEIPPEPNTLPKSLGKRYPWWEHLVAKVLENESETLCLT